MLRGPGGGALSGEPLFEFSGVAGRELEIFLLNRLQAYRWPAVPADDDRFAAHGERDQSAELRLGL